MNIRCQKECDVVAPISLLPYFRRQHDLRRRSQFFFICHKVQLDFIVEGDSSELCYMEKMLRFYYDSPFSFALTGIGLRVISIQEIVSYFLLKFFEERKFVQNRY